MHMQIITAPEILNIKTTSIFLAGSIEQDQAERWQDRVIESLKPFDVAILNPRRAVWNEEWKQSIEVPEFNQQVKWELDALEKADFILMYFDPNTKSPISLLELGLFAKSGKLSVCCPEGFWRKGNVDIVCHRYGIPQFESLEEMVNTMMKWISAPVSFQKE